MAAIAAVATAFSTLQLSRTSLILPRRHFRSVVTCAFSTTTAEFNITFAPPKPKPQLPKPSTDTESADSSSSEVGDQLLIPWIVRDEKGNLTLRTSPPEGYLKDMAHQNTQKKKKKDSKSTASKPTPLSIEPKYSKAARRFYNERFREPPQRLAKVLAAAGVASRRSSEELIFQGRVTVNGSVCNTPQTKVDPGRDIIYVNGSRLAKKLPPKGWSKRNAGLPKPRLFTVGRLDVATTGLIIVTNVGEFANKVPHPSFNLSKEYIATINGEVNKRQLIAISEGTVIEGVHCTPDLVELLPQQPDISRPRLRIVVHEGRNHEVRELVKNAGLQIHALKRVRIGNFRLPTDLGLGKHVELTAANLRALGWKS